MGSASINILTINAGSSSLKVGFSAFDADTGSTAAITINVATIGAAVSRVSTQIDGGAANSEDVFIADHVSAMNYILKILADKHIDAVGHRIVHGGTDYSSPVIIDDEVIQKLSALSALDPHHMPAALELIGILQSHLPDVPHVACFDTAFFHDIPRLAQMTTLPRAYEDRGVRRYGFHGLSYQYIQSAFRDIAGDTAVNGRVVYAHLGSGASLAATRDGRPQDMTMGFSPVSGIMMSSRSGDLDPALAQYFGTTLGVDSAAYDHMVNFESGLLGVSGVSADMKVLIDAMDGDPHAREAVELFCYQVAKSVAALATTIGGLDSLIFSGGIGEQAPLIRQMICDRLYFLGVQLDDDANQHHGTLISSSWSAVGVHVIPTDESQTILRAVYQTVTTREK